MNVGTAPANASVLRQRACLEERLVDLRGMIDVFERADAALVNQAVPATESLPRVAQCSSGAKPLAVPPPSDPATLAQVAKVREQLAHLRALRETQSWKAMAPLVEPNLADARATGYRPLEAQALMAVAAVSQVLGDRQRASAALEEAALIADAVSDDRTRAFALLNAATQLPHHELTSPAGEAKMAQALAAAGRLPEDNELQYFANFVAGLRLGIAARNADAEEALRRALGFANRAYGEEGLRTALLLSAIAFLTGDLGRPNEALEMSERAYYVMRASVGAEAPSITLSHTASAALLTELERHEEAAARVQEALRIAEREYGLENATTLSILDQLGQTHCDRGQPREALRLHERTLPIQLKVGEESAITSLLGIGRAQLALDAPLAAIPPLERAIRIEHSASKRLEIAEVEVTLAEALRRTKRTPSRVRSLLVHARESFASAGRTPRRAKVLARIDALLAAKR